MTLAHKHDIFHLYSAMQQTLWHTILTSISGGLMARITLNKCARSEITGAKS